jgi:hypothetical protein
MLYADGVSPRPANRFVRENAWSASKPALKGVRF